MVVEPICRRFALTSTWWIISKTWKCQNQKRWNEYLWKFTTTQCWKEMIPNINQALVWLLSWVICDERLKPLWQMKGSWNVKENWSIKNLMKHIWNLPITDTPPKTLSCKISFKKKIPFSTSLKCFRKNPSPFSILHKATPKKMGPTFPAALKHGLMSTRWRLLPSRYFGQTQLHLIREVIQTRFLRGTTQIPFNPPG